MATQYSCSLAIRAPLGSVCSAAYLDVISNVVPKIWARTNSAILRVVWICVQDRRMGCCDKRKGRYESMDCIGVERRCGCLSDAWMCGASSVPRMVGSLREQNVGLLERCFAGSERERLKLMSRAVTAVGGEVVWRVSALEC